MIKILCLVAGTIWLITALYVNSSPNLNIKLHARKPETVAREQTLLSELGDLQNSHASIERICQQYRLLAIYYSSANNYEKAEDTLLECLKLLQNTSNAQTVNAMYSTTYNLLAQFWLNRGDFVNADVVYRKSQAYCPKNSLLSARNTNDTGVLYYLWSQATSDRELRRRRLSQSEDFFKSSFAQLEACNKEVEKNDWKFMQSCLKSNYQQAIVEGNYNK